MRRVAFAWQSQLSPKVCNGILARKNGLHLVERWTDEQISGVLMGKIEGLVASHGRLKMFPQIEFLDRQDQENRHAEKSEHPTLPNNILP